MFINLQISSFWDANYFLFQNLPLSLTLCFLFLFSFSSLLSLPFCPTSYYLQIKSFSKLQPYLKSFYLLTLVAQQKQQNTTKTKTKTLHDTKTKTKKTKKISSLNYFHKDCLRNLVLECLEYWKGKNALIINKSFLLYLNTMCIWELSYISSVFSCKTDMWKFWSCSTIFSHELHKHSSQSKLVKVLCVFYFRIKNIAARSFMHNFESSVVNITPLVNFIKKKYLRYPVKVFHIG